MSLVTVQCDKCGQVYQVQPPPGGFPADCGLCKPPGAGKIRPVQK